MFPRRLAAVALLLLIVPVTPPRASASVPAPDFAQRTHTASTHHVFYHLNAYRGGPGNGYCEGGWSDDFGACWGYGEQTSLDSHPFAGRVIWQWHRHGTEYCPRIPDRDHTVWTHELYLWGDGESTVCGWIDQNWSNFAVTGGNVKVGHHLYPVRRTSTDRHRRTLDGGPIGIHLSSARDGYVLRMHGYLTY